MIKWIKYDPANPPEVGTESMLVLDSDGDPWTAWHVANDWRNDVTGDPISEVTHYAHINLPGEDKADV